MKSDRLWPRPYADEIAAAGIVIDADGRRFADEGFGGIYLSNVVARLPDPLGATIVFDQAIWDWTARPRAMRSRPIRCFRCL